MGANSSRFRRNAGWRHAGSRTAAEAVKCVDERAARVIKAPIVLR